MRKNVLPLFFCLVLLAAFSKGLKVEATDVDIDIYTTDDADIDVNMTAQSLNASIVMNGVDVLEEHRELESAFNAYVIAGWWSHNALERIDELQSRLEALISDLNLAFSDVYGNIGYIYGITGVSHNSTDVVENLRSGNMTVAGYIEEQMRGLDRLNATVSELQANVTREVSDIRVEIQDLRDQVEAGQNKTDSQIIFLRGQVDAMSKVIETQGSEIELLRQDYQYLLYVCGALVVVAFAAVLGMMRVRLS